MVFKHISHVSDNCIIFNAIYKISFCLAESSYFHFILCTLAVPATLVERGIKKKKKKTSEVIENRVFTLCVEEEKQSLMLLTIYLHLTILF